MGKSIRNKKKLHFRNLYRDALDPWEHQKLEEKKKILDNIINTPATLPPLIDGDVEKNTKPMVVIEQEDETAEKMEVDDGNREKLQSNIGKRTKKTTTKNKNKKKKKKSSVSRKK